jgi:hypothetical protein
LYILQVVDSGIIGCVIESACNYNPIAGLADNSLCLFPDCTDELACNFNTNANCPDSTLCVYAAPYFDCSGICISDSDNDGVCDELEVVGCTDTLACNYDVLVTESDSSCTYAEQHFDCLGGCLNDTDGDGICDELESDGCGDSLACNYNPIALNPDSALCSYPSCIDSIACNFNVEALCGDTALCEYPLPFLACDGTCLNDTDGDGVCDELEIMGCDDLLACNYDAAVTESDSTCVFAETYYDCAGACLNDSDNDGVCDELESEGCTDSLACNYSATVLTDDGSCVYPGCTDSSACNYDILAGCDNGTCIMPDACGSCTGISGCTDALACNYDSLASCDDSSCFWLETFAILGLDSVLMDSLAVYAYADQPGSSYAWTVTGGTIIGQADTSLIVVNWGPAGVGEVCVIETQDSCVGQEVCMEVVISDPSSIAEWNDGAWLIYPNPSTGLFRLVTRDLSLRSYEILDAFGKVAHSGSLQNISTEVDLTSLAAGHYIVKSGTLHKRIVIVR